VSVPLMIKLPVVHIVYNFCFVGKIICMFGIDSTLMGSFYDFIIDTIIVNCDIP
jgi:hypothetical protein